MLTEYLLALILEMINMPAEISAGILALYQEGLLNLILSAVNICFCMICISIKKSVFEQSGMTLVREPVTVMAGGVMWYGLGIALILVFLLSVVGFPVALVILLVMAVFIFIGQASLSVMFGKIFADKIYKALGTYPSALVGALIIEVFNYLPYIQWLFRFLIWPVLALGVLSAGFVNGYIKKIFYPIDSAQKPPRDRESMREMVLRKYQR